MSAVWGGVYMLRQTVRSVHINTSLFEDGKGGKGGYGEDKVGGSIANEEKEDTGSCGIEKDGQDISNEIINNMKDYNNQENESSRNYQGMKNIECENETDKRAEKDSFNAQQDANISIPRSPPSSTSTTTPSSTSRSITVHICDTTSDTTSSSTSSSTSRFPLKGEVKSFKCSAYLSAANRLKSHLIPLQMLRSSMTSRVLVCCVGDGEELVGAKNR